MTRNVDFLSDLPALVFDVGMESVQENKKLAMRPQSQVMHFWYNVLFKLLLY